MRMDCEPLDWAKSVRQRTRRQQVLSTELAGGKVSFIKTDERRVRPPRAPQPRAVEDLGCHFEWCIQHVCCTSVQPGRCGRTWSPAEWRQETHFHSFNNQAGVWVELIALGIHPTCSFFVFLYLHVGPTLFNGERNGVMAGFSLVGRTQHAHGLSVHGNWVLMQTNRAVEPPIFNLTDRADNVKPSLFENFLTSPDASHQSLSGIFVSTFLSFRIGI